MEFRGRMFGRDLSLRGRRGKQDPAEQSGRAGRLVEMQAWQGFN